MASSAVDAFVTACRAALAEGTERGDGVTALVHAAGLAVDATVTDAELRNVHAPLAAFLWGLVASRVKGGSAGAQGRRVVVGLSGPAGGGKSVLGQLLARTLPLWPTVTGDTNGLHSHLAAAGFDASVAVLGVDGYHRLNADLDASGLRAVNGRPETFDTIAFRRDLARLRQPTGATLLPAYDRGLHEPVPDAVTVDARCPLVVVEGILLFTEAFAGDDDKSCSAFDARVWLDVPVDEAERRVNERKLRGGRSHEAVAAHYARVDGPNHADMIAAAAAHPADVVLAPAEPGSTEWRLISIRNLQL